MQTYASLSGSSGVRAFDIPDDASIVVQFINGTYLYTANGVGSDNIAEMQRRAVAGRGLSTFISRDFTVRHGYSDRW